MLTNNEKTTYRLRLRYWLSYAAVLFFPFVLYVSTFVTSNNAIRKHIHDAHLNALQQSQELVDTQMQQISALVFQLSDDPEISKALYYDSTMDSRAYRQMESAVNRFANYLQNNELIVAKNSYIYLPHADKVLLYESVYPTATYYNFVLKFPREGYEQWKKMLSGRYTQGTYLDITQYSAGALAPGSQIAWIQALPQSYRQSYRGALVINMDKGALLRHFRSVQQIGNTTVYIEDAQGRMIADIAGSDATTYLDLLSFEGKGSFFTTTINGKQLLITHTVSPQNGWRYVSVMPETEALGQLDQFQRLMVLYVVIVVILGVLASGYMAHRQSKPLITLSNTLREAFPSQQEQEPLAVIEGGISRLVQNNQALKKDLDNQRPLMRSTLANSLFNGQCSSLQTLQTLSSGAGISLDFQCFITVYIRLNTPEGEEGLTQYLQNTGIRKALIRTMVKEHYPKRSLAYEPDYHTIGLLLEVEPDAATQRQMLSQFLNHMAQTMGGQYNTFIYCAVGGSCKSPLDVWRSAQQAQQALAYANAGNPIVWYETLHQEGDSYFYPLGIEQRLMNATSAGDIEQVHQLLDTVVEENIVKRTLTPEISLELAREMRGTVRRISISYPDLATVKKQLKGWQLTGMSDAFLTALRQTYQLLCEQAQKKRSSTNATMIGEIQTYLQQNYADPDLGLYKAATQFRLSEGYLSYFFREGTGTNFAEYLEKLRLSKAEELLKAGNITVDQIAKQVGYNSAQSFRRAFKKVYGISPTAMRT